MGSSISARCVIARAVKKMTRQDACSALGFSLRTLRRIETKDRNDIDLYKEMAKVYGVSEIWLIHGLGPILADARLIAVAQTWDDLPDQSRNDVLALAISGKSTAVLDSSD